MTERLTSGEKFYMFFTVGFFFPFSPNPWSKKKAGISTEVYQSGGIEFRFSEIHLSGYSSVLDATHKDL